MNTLIKNLLLTATLATAAFVGGYQLDNVVRIAMEARAYMQGVQVDPENAFWHCYHINDKDPSKCETQAQAWAARDGADALLRITAGMARPELAKPR